MSFIDKSTLVLPANSAFPGRRWLDTRNPVSGLNGDYRNFQISDLWINNANNTAWIMVNKTATSGTWIQAASAGTGILTITGNSGGAISPDGSENIFLLGGTGITFAGNSSTNTLTATVAASVPLQFDEDSGNATPALNILRIIGTGGLSTSGLGNTVTVTAGGTIPTLFTEDSGTATPSAHNLNVLGGTGIATSGSGSTITIATSGTVAKLYTEDSGSAVPSGGNLNILGASGITTSGSGSTVTVTAGGTIPTLFTENSGTATPSAHNLNILGSGGITTSGSGSTVTITPGSTLATTYTEDSGTAAPSANNLNIVGSGGITTSGAGSTVTVTAGGSIPTSFVENVGSAVPSSHIINVVGGTGIATSGSGNTITITNTSTSSTTFNEDAGSATPSAGVINILGGSNIATSGAGNTVTVAFSPPTTQTWTPVLTFGGGSTGITYSSRLGYYQKLGNMVFFWYAIQLTNKGSSTGAAIITGLPFTSQTPSVGSSVSIAQLQTAIVTFSAGYTYAGSDVIGATSTIQLLEMGSGGLYQPMTHASFANTSECTASGFYFTS